MNALAKYDQARQALAACRSVDEIKDIRDKSEAMRLYAKQAQDTELEQWAAEIKFRAQRALGELSATLPTQKGGFGIVPTGGKHKAEVLAEAGISTSTANRYEKLASIPEPVIEEIIAKSKEAGKPVSAKAVLAKVAAPAPRSPVEKPAPAPAVVPTPASVPPTHPHIAAPAFAAPTVPAIAGTQPVICQPQVDMCQPAGAIYQPGLQATAIAAAAPALAEAKQSGEGAALNADPASDIDTSDDDPFVQLVDENRKLEQDKLTLQGEVERLTQRIALLTREDLAAQVDALTQKVAQFDSLATARFNEIARLNETINGQRAFIDGLRRAAGLPKGGDLVAWVKAAARRAA